MSSMPAGLPVPADPAASPTGAGTASAPASRRARIRLAAAARGVPLATILTSVAVVVLTYLAGKLVYRLRDVILIVIVAGFIALILNPAVACLERWRIRRGWAVAAVTIAALIAFVAVTAAFGYPLVNGLTHLSHELPGYVQDAEQGHGRIGALLRRLHLTDWVTRNAPKLQTLGEKLARPALSVGKGALSLLVTLGTIAVLVLLFLLEGPKMGRRVLNALAPQKAARYSRIAGEINASVIGYAVGDLLTSLIAGVVVFITLAALGVPFPLLWALWVALVDFLPMIGGALAGIPTVLFAFGHSVTAGLVTAAAFITYQQVENHVLNPLIMSRTVKVSPMVVLLSVLVGTSIGDWIGGTFAAFVAALLSIPAAGTLQIIGRELWRATDLGVPAPPAAEQDQGADRA